MKTEHEKLQKYWTITLDLLRPFLKWLYGYSYEIAPEIEGNYLVLANHNSNLDPWLCGLSFKRQMYFLAGENVYRLGFLSVLVKNLWAPISKVKGKSDVTAMMKLLRHLKDGHNCSLFPEGNRSFDGRTEQVGTAIGKLAKTSGASLVTFKFEGLYFSTPRWGTFMRRGKASGKVINVYTKEQLKEMTAEEVAKHINEDIYEDAYATQEKNPVKFKNHKRAETIESVLFACPSCTAISSITSKKHSFWCKKCNAKAIFSEFGYIEGDFKYKTITEWEAWQQTHIKTYIDKCLKETPKKPLLWDDYVELTLVDIDHNEKIISKGKFEFYADKIKVGNYEYLFKGINNFDMVFRRTLLFNTKLNENFQIFSKQFLCARSYIFAFRYLQSKTK